MSPLLNVAAFNAVWAAVVLGAAHGRDGLGLAALLAWLPVHLRLSGTPRRDAALFVGLGLFGPAIDAVLMHAQLIRFSGWTLHPDLPPVWLAALWANFALVVNHSLRGILQRPLLAAAFGALGGPLAYWAGARLGAATFVDPGSALLLLAIAWGALAPLIGLAGATPRPARVSP